MTRRRLWLVVAAGPLLVVGAALTIAPYRITQDSMEPTLHEGDLVLGWRPSVFGGPPPRWSEALFAHPRDDAKVLIKRLVGLPGETIGLRNGDVHIDGRVASKPADLQERLWLPVLREGPAAALLQEHFSRGATPEYQARFRAQDGPPGDSPSPGRFYVDDLRLSLQARASAPGELWIDLPKNGHRLRVVFAFGRGGGKIVCGVHESPLPDLSLGQLARLSAAIWDGLAEARADDRVVRQELEILEAGRDVGPPGPRIVVIDGPIIIERLALDRDIFYRPVPGLEDGVGLTVPAEAFYALGDHSAASEDSRRWGPVPLNRLIARAFWSGPWGR